MFLVANNLFVVIPLYFLHLLVPLLSCFPEFWLFVVNAGFELFFEDFWDFAMLFFWSFGDFKGPLKLSYFRFTSAFCWDLWTWACWASCWNLSRCSMCLYFFYFSVSRTWMRLLRDCCLRRDSARWCSSLCLERCLLECIKFFLSQYLF